MKFRSISLLLIAEVAALSVWFVSAAILPDMQRETPMTPFRQAAMSSAVQAGFVVGALVSAILGLADRYDPRRVFATSAILASFTNAILIICEPGSAAAIASRALTGALMAGIYPVGMKIAVGWGKDDRGFLVGALVGALTLGSAVPHLIALGGGADWHLTVALASLLVMCAGLLCMFVSLGPYHAAAPRFSAKAVTLAWTDRRIRLAYAGYLGHMWELYAMWAWVGVATAVSFSAHLGQQDAEWLAKLTAFLAIAAGGVTSVAAGAVADRVGKAEIAAAAMVVSGGAAILTALTFGGPVWLTIVLVIIWGAAIVPDSAQFSALVADAAPPDQAGSLMSFQTALGFALTFATVQVTPVLADAFGWPVVLAGLALGPAFGIAAMMRLRSLNR